jgi:hypothetical protein
MVANKSDITIIKLTIYMGTIKAQKKAQTCASKGLPGNHPAKVRPKHQALWWVAGHSHVLRPALISAYRPDLFGAETVTTWAEFA